MDNIIAVELNEKAVQPYEIRIVTDAKPDFLPPVTLVRTEKSAALLYSGDDLLPFSDAVKRQGNFGLGMVFALMTGYINCLLEAHDRMLNTALLSSDPEKGVFLNQSGTDTKVKVVWGADPVAGAHEKICRIASFLAGFERVMGAGASMKRLCDIITSENPSLINCLKATERVCREWNRITQTFT